MKCNYSSDLIHYLIHDLHVPRKCIAKFNQVPSHIEKRNDFLSTWRNIVVMSEASPVSFFDPEKTIFIVLPDTTQSLLED
jgi:hypothetical protein